MTGEVKLEEVILLSHPIFSTSELLLRILLSILGGEKGGEKRGRVIEVCLFVCEKKRGFILRNFLLFFFF